MLSSIATHYLLYGCLLIVGQEASIVSAEGAPLRECWWDSHCQELYHPAATCDTNLGKCVTNPFVGGCLQGYDKGNSTNAFEELSVTAGLTTDYDLRAFQGTKRICNTDDYRSSNYQNCQRSAFNYTEIRVHNGNWESAIFYSWIVQIFLSEFLQVPTTVGLTSANTAASSFYDPDDRFSYSPSAYPYDALKRANELNARCDLTDEECTHVLPEVWIGQRSKLEELHAQHVIDQVSSDGQVGKISWYVPAFTANRHPEVASFRGLSGRRDVVAEIFKRPTTWQDYCDMVSPTNCEEADEVAERAPDPDSESGLYFSSGSYTGHFRYTNSNNCTANPDTCTGHIVNAPCSWSTFLESQAYWSDINMVSEGSVGENSAYSYGQMIQIWRAANATQENVIMWWWTPDATMEEFRGSPGAFQAILLPEPTATCRASRISLEDRCSADPLLRRGSEEGACDNESNSLQKIIAASVRDTTFATPEVDRSPAYDAIRNLKVNHLDMNKILQQWGAGGHTGFAARNAVCDWIVSHKDELETYIPRGYPRVIEDENKYDTELLKAAQAVAVFAVAYVLVVWALVFKFRSTKVFVFAQVFFIYMVLFGLLMVAIGGLFYALEPRNALCVSRIWVTTLGYTLELVPLLVKVAAINRVISATQRMRRVRISPKSLYSTVAVVVLAVVVFLSVWTSVDAPQRIEQRVLVYESDIVEEFVTCASDSTVWNLVVLSWEGFLIVCATVLAFQSRNVQQEFNDSRTLGTMIYSHFVFAVVRSITFNMLENEDNLEDSSFAPHALNATVSLLLSLDVITAMTIYLVPKLNKAHANPRPHSRASTTTVGEMVASEAVREIQMKASQAMSGYLDSQVEPEHSVGRKSSTSSKRATVNFATGEINTESATHSNGSDTSSLHRRGNQQDSNEEIDTGGPRLSRPVRTPSMDSPIEPIKEVSSDVEQEDRESALPTSYKGN